VSVCLSGGGNREPRGGDRPAARPTEAAGQWNHLTTARGAAGREC